MLEYKGLKFLEYGTGYYLLATYLPKFDVIQLIVELN
jgi:hypothetical protein